MEKNKKPIIGYIAGSTLVMKDKMGYAGDIITGGKLTVQNKKEAMKNAGIEVVDNINQIHKVLQNLK